MGNHVDSEDKRLAMVLNDVSSNHVEEIPELSKKEIAEIRKHNLNVRMLAYKEVRRPGKSKYRLSTVHRDTMCKRKVSILKITIKKRMNSDEVTGHCCC